MSESVFACVRCDRESPVPLEQSPFPTKVGDRVLAEICSECWEEWKQRQMSLINHYGLRLQDERAREFLYENLRSFLFAEGAAADIDTSQEGSVEW